MNEISALPQNVAQWLGEQEQLNEMKFVTEFPPAHKAVPLKRVTVAVGFSKISILDLFPANEDFPPEEEYCRQAIITLRFSVHAPYSLGGGACHRAFADIIDCLTFASALEIRESGCEQIYEDRNTDALVLNAWAQVVSSLCPAQSTDLIFPSFLDKTLFCGSHIRDENIHLSENQQQFLETPIISGSYYGNGEGTRLVNLGFNPLWVTVFAGGLPQSMGENPVKIYSATGNRSDGTLGLERSENGFRVKNGATHSYNGYEPRLNESGIKYSYLTVKV